MPKNKSKTLFMETTKIPAAKTANEIIFALVSAGARQIAIDYDQQQNLSGLRFTFLLQNVLVPFVLPVRTEPVYQILWARRDKTRLPFLIADQEKLKARDRAQAERVAWRQLLRWVQAQIALIQTGMVETAEVFMPYIISPTGMTMFQEFKDSGLKMIAAPPASNHD